jgi:hypothetical protein
MTELAKVRAEDREEVIARVRDAGFDVGKKCEACGGEGKVFPGRRVIHSVRCGLGADWDEDAVIELVQQAKAVWWGPSLLKHDLAVQEPDGEWIFFRVSHPDRPRQQPVDQ